MGKKAKMTKAERKAAELEKEAATGIRVRYYPRSFLWNVLCVTLAFLFGIFIALGGLLGVGILYGSTATSKDLFGDNYSDYLRDDYADLTLFELTKELIDAVNDVLTAGGDLTLNTIGKITPILENLLNPLSDSLGDLGIHLNVNEFMDVPVSGMGSYFQEKIITNIVLGETIGVNPDSDSILIALCYGEEDVDYTVEDGKFVMKEGKSPLKLGDLTSGNITLLDRLTIETALNVNAESSAPVRYLAYGTEGVHYEIRDGKVVMLTNPYTGEPFRKKSITDLTSSDGLIENARISDLINLEGNTNELLNAIGNWKISELKQQARMSRLKLGQVIHLDESSSRLMRAIADWRIEDLTNQERIESLTLGDVLAVDASSPKLLRSLDNAQIGELGGTMNTLRLNELLELEDIANNKLLRNLGSSTMSTLANDIQELSIVQIFGNGLYSFMVGEAGSYQQTLQKFKDGDPDSVPTAIPSDAEITTSYRLNGDTLSLGWFTNRNGKYQLIDETDVIKSMVTGDDGGKTVSYSVERKLTVEPIYNYLLIDFEADSRIPLPADAISTVTEGYADGTVSFAGEPVTQNGLPLYYHTERVKPAAGEPNEQDDELDEVDPTPETELVYYPLLQDDFGVFCVYLAPDGTIERIDFDNVPVSYEAEEGVVEVITNDSGKASYNKVRYTAEGGTPVEIRLHHAKAVSDPESGDELTPAYDYIVVQDSVEQRYYMPSASEGVTEYDVTYALDTPSVATVYTASWTDGDGTQHNDVTVDRFLHGFWYLLLGGETVDEEGNVTVIDDAAVAILEVDKKVTAATTKMNEIALGELYFHGLIAANPNVRLPNGKNLSEMTISETIAYLRQFSASFGG